MKRPILVGVIALLMLIGGVLEAGLSAILLLSGGAFGGSMAVWSGLLMLIMAIAAIVAALGLFKMKRWALYVAIILAAISVVASGYSAVQSSFQVVSLVELIIAALIIVYFWLISKKFN